MKIIQLPDCHPEVQKCSELIKIYSNFGQLLPYSYVHNSTGLVCNAGLNELNQTISENYVYAPKGSIPLVRSNDFPKLALKTNAAEPDYKMVDDVLEKNILGSLWAIYMGFYVLYLGNGKSLLYSVSLALTVRLIFLSPFFIEYSFIGHMANYLITPTSNQSSSLGYVFLNTELTEDFAVYGFEIYGKSYGNVEFGVSFLKTWSKNIFLSCFGKCTVSTGVCGKTQKLLLTLEETLIALFDLNYFENFINFTPISIQVYQVQQL